MQLRFVCMYKIFVTIIWLIGGTTRRTSLRNRVPIFRRFENFFPSQIQVDEIRTECWIEPIQAEFSSTYNFFQRTNNEIVQIQTERTRGSEFDKSYCELFVGTYYTLENLSRRIGFLYQRWISHHRTGNLRKILFIVYSIPM